MFQVKGLSKNSKPWWKWISKEDLRSLHEQHVRKPKRNSIEVAKNRAATGSGSEGKSTSQNQISKESDVVTHIENLSKINNHGDVNHTYPNEGFMNTKEMDAVGHDYAYSGYTLEITPKVGLIPVVIKPISPVFNSSMSFALGVKTPTFSTI